MGLSNNVSIGDTVEAAQYNDLRTDVNDDAASHDHSATGRNGQQLGLSGLLPEVTDRLMNFQTQARATGNWPEAGLTEVLNISGKGVLTGLTLVGNNGTVSISNDTYTIEIEVDGVIIVSHATGTYPAALNPSWAHLTQAHELGWQPSSGSGQAADQVNPGSVAIYFTTSLIVRLNKAGTIGTEQFFINYAEDQ